MNSLASTRINLLLISWLLLFYDCNGITWNWETWWTYNGISGPEFWGLINPDWTLCNKGRRQSPIDVDPSRLLYDPNLRHLHVDKRSVTGVLENTGYSVLFSVESGKAPLNVTGGPLSYKYQLTEAQLHFGSADLQGSEHTINGRAFPAELQVFGFNSQLYSNYSQAVDKAYGLVAISILLQIGRNPAPELKLLMDGIEKVKFVGDSTTIKDISLHDLLPDTPYYLTYEGSTTTPACHETVTWVLINKPAYISKEQLDTLREVRRSEETLLANNFRTPQKLHHRPVRTNIDFTNSGGDCPSMHRGVYYKANSYWFNT